MGTERDEDDAAAVEERPEGVALLGREAGRIVEQDAEVAGEVLGAIGKRRDGTHVDIELERRERLLDDGRAARGDGLFGGVGDDGDGAASRLREDRRHVVARHGVAPGEPRARRDGVVRRQKDAASRLRARRRVGTSEHLAGGVLHDDRAARGAAGPVRTRP